ncbi:MAG: UDP-N-acetylmuramoyl-L-alanine--D-glutamate ligase [Chloroflexi bacterium]|nr:UDP-N-acetylmuramoyl-L-alanine--D-glutamate ligase [Chloroflexota bacterium]MBV6437791.1 UDP-N-acetylmuramoylalanine--D-glutamate ligase [Anaerolineae bacterium]MDL1916515.1 UDP-N-acetylmuramoyl-L-alanine--D-glutamate ligase [Anaerolineae bacterium CFX4]OQY81968.1 MAG: UDP-N-acetylmuramoyl-L-alanine--D-glutamate ligase [Anaerolineae bacterium UTCFX5]MBW7880618.1 UDP-N-acetylmuramoyl-L-alanine--D-glutamate ligase [Anaerolineae bacterium]
MLKHFDILNGRRVVIVGFARQGQALARWLPTVGARPIVTDSKTAEQLGVDPNDFPGVRFVLGENPSDLLDRADLVCVSGGVPLTIPLIVEAAAREIPVTNDAQLFVDRCPAPLIGITGSAGKTTTTTLVGQMVKAGGFQTWVGGNIGSVLLDVLNYIQPKDRVVMELSSFQLELMHSSPTIGAILNVTPNHLDRHGTMEAYMNAKSQLIAHQNGEGIAVLNKDDMGSMVMEGLAPGEVCWFTRREIVSDGAFLAGERLFVSGHSSTTGDPQYVCDVADIPLRGTHNVSNVLAACAIAGAAGIAPEPLAATIKAFKGVPHRLETVRVINGVTWVNDSIATAPERVLAALDSYTEPIVLLLGGADKKLPWNELMAVTMRKCRHIVCFGRDGDIPLHAMEQVNGDTAIMSRVGTLDEAVAEAARVAQAGDVVLLSPGMTSYDAYLNFEVRGESFRALVAGLAEG